MANGITGCLRRSRAQVVTVAYYSPLGEMSDGTLFENLLFVFLLYWEAMVYTYLRYLIF